MLRKFFTTYECDQPMPRHLDSVLGGEGPSTIEDFRSALGNVSVDKRLYTFHSNETARSWRTIVGTFFEVAPSVEFFAFDWRGNQIAFDASQSSVLMFDVATGEFFRIDSGLLQFHDEIMACDPDVPSRKAYRRWLKKNSELKQGQCVGFRIPLVLGGRDELSNMEAVDMDVYWNIVGQLVVKLVE